MLTLQAKKLIVKLYTIGPGLGGKTTNIQFVYQKMTGKADNDLVTLSTENERTLFFDFLPLELGEIRGYKTRFHLYTVPGQVIYEASRKLILRGVDGIVFVADSQVEKMESNIDSLRDLEQNLTEQGYDISTIPMVFQWNKRDLPNVMAKEEMDMRLNKWSCEAFEGMAIEGQGVFECLKAVTKKVLVKIKRDF